jgi:hypothetical protein
VAYEDEVLADNPITYFRLDETGGATTANDLGSANNDGTYQAGYMRLNTSEQVNILRSGTANIDASTVAVHDDAWHHVV